MILQKHLSIKEARNEIEKLNNELDLYLTNKKINFLKTQPGSTKFKEIVTSKSNKIFDKFCHYVIKDEDYDIKIYSLQESILSYETYIIKEMKRIYSNGGSEEIVFLRDEEEMEWQDISNITNYSVRQCHRLYDQSKK